MKNILCTSTLTLIFIFTAKSQFCVKGKRFTDKPFFPETAIITQTATYAQAPDYSGKNVVLKMNLFYPDVTIDPMPARPLILLIHGGGFTDGNRQKMDSLCFEFARRGFVSVTISYRLGYNCAEGPLEYDKAVYRAQQDANAALRYLVHFSSIYKIDTNWLFIGGGSAGAVTALNTAYLSQNDWNTAFPTISTTLGLLTQSGNPLTETFSLKGIMNNWGATNPNYIQAPEFLPTISFHGELDQTVDVDQGPKPTCNITAPPTYVSGSRHLYQLSLSQGVCSELYVKSDGDHGVYEKPARLRTGLTSNFFKSLFCNNCSSAYYLDFVLQTQAPIANKSNTSVNSVFPEGKFITFPNPVKDVLQIQTDKTEPFKVTVLSIIGETLLTAENPETLDLSNLSKGSYILKIDNMRSSTKHIIIKE